MKNLIRFFAATVMLLHVTNIHTAQVTFDMNTSGLAYDKVTQQLRAYTKTGVLRTDKQVQAITDVDDTTEEADESTPDTVTVLLAEKANTPKELLVNINKRIKELLSEICYTRIRDKRTNDALTAALAYLIGAQMAVIDYTEEVHGASIYPEARTARTYAEFANPNKKVAGDGTLQGGFHASKVGKMMLPRQAKRDREKVVRKPRHASITE